MYSKITQLLGQTISTFIFHDNHLCGHQSSLLLLFVRAVVCQVSVVFLSSADRLQLAPKTDQNNLPVSPTVISRESDGLKVGMASTPAPDSHLVSPDSVSRTAALMRPLVSRVRTGVHFLPFVAACCWSGAEMWRRCASDFG